MSNNNDMFADRMKIILERELKKCFHHIQIIQKYYNIQNIQKQMYTKTMCKHLTN